MHLNTWLVDVETTNVSAGGVKTITAAICENQQSQRRYIVKAKVFIDTTGDGRLGAEAGAEWLQGREGKAKYNESLQPDKADNETQGSSYLYEVEDTGKPTPFVPPFWAKKFNKSEFRYRSVGANNNGFWWNEVSWPYNTITDGEQVTQEGIANSLGLWDYLKNSGDHPESANLALSWLGVVPGKREGRRFVGQFVSTQNDIYKEVAPKGKPQTHPQEPDLYWDRVSFAGWPSHPGLRAVWMARNGLPADRRSSEWQRNLFESNSEESISLMF